LQLLTLFSVGECVALKNASSQRPGVEQGMMQSMDHVPVHKGESHPLAGRRDLLVAGA